MQNQQLKDTLKTLYEYADELERKGGYSRIGKNTLKEYFRFDLLKYLLWLSDDGGFSKEETEFANDVLGFRYSSKEYRDFYVNLNISKKFQNSVPDSYTVFVTEEQKSNFAAKTSVAQTIADFYRILGICFVSADHNATESEVYRLTEYIVFLRSDGQAQASAQGVVEADSEARDIDEVLGEMDQLVGLEEVKKDVRSLINLIKIRKIREERGIKQTPMSLHLVFSGNPGTGKTTVARLLSEIYKSIGLLSKGHLYETDRSGLVAGYVGQTALKVTDAIEKSLGGVLFIDEAYALTMNVQGNDFGQEAIATLIKQMEDHRDDLVVIVAGYTDLMEEFLNSNPGMKSRFNKFIYFADYDVDELMGILALNLSKMQLVFSKKAESYSREFFEERVASKGANFANGRDVRNFFERALTNQANRLSEINEISDEMLGTLIYADVKDIQFKS